MSDDAPTKYRFLTEDWITNARKVQEEFRGRSQEASTQPIRINQIITELPFPPGRIESHFDTTTGELELDLGFMDEPDVTVTMPYDTAKRVFIEGDQAGAMQAFLEGKIQIDGDMTKLMLLQSGALDPLVLEAQARIRAITE